MEKMWVNYVLIGVFGLFTVVSILQRIRAGHFLGRPSRTVLSAIVFLMALAATIMNVPITQMKTIIEEWIRPNG